MKPQRMFFAAVLIAGVTASAGLVGQQYDLAALAKFRADRETTLKRDDNWLTVAGLHFLSQGANRVGSDPSNDIVLDYPSVPKHVGVITVKGTSVNIRAAEGQTLSINDVSKTESELHGDFDQKPRDTLAVWSSELFRSLQRASSGAARA